MAFTVPGDYNPAPDRADFPSLKYTYRKYWTPVARTSEGRWVFFSRIYRVSLVEEYHHRPTRTNPIGWYSEEELIILKLKHDISPHSV